MSFNSPPSLKPSTVVISFPSHLPANTTQLCTAIPSSITVHAPQWLVSQPRLVPVNPKFSLSTSNNSAVSFASVSVSSPLICSLSFAIAVPFRLLYRRRNGSPNHNLYHFPPIVGGAVRIRHRISLRRGDFCGFTNRSVSQRRAAQGALRFARSKRHRRHPAQADSYLLRFSCLLAIRDYHHGSTGDGKILRTDGMLQVNPGRFGR